MKRVFLIHGWEGTPNNHWFPWLKAELIARGFKVFAPAMPHADLPKISEWLAMIREWVGKPDLETFFVGHSLGCIATLRYLETLAPKAVVGGAVFVAGFHKDLGIPQIQDFFQSPVSIEKARKHSYKFACIFSDDDKYIPLANSFELAQELGARTMLEKGRRHFMKSEGVEALPSALKFLLDFSQTD